MKTDLLDIGLGVLIIFLTQCTVYFGGYLILGWIPHWISIIIAMVLSVILNMILSKSFRDTWFRVWHRVSKLDE